MEIDTCVSEDKHIIRHYETIEHYICVRMRE